MADVCAAKNIHCTTFGTGFLYTYDDAHPKGSGVGFKVHLFLNVSFLCFGNRWFFFQEDEPANYSKPYYCKLRIWLEDMLKAYPNVLNLRFVGPPCPVPYTAALTCFCNI